MMAPESRVQDGKTYMWDGEEYPLQEAARTNLAKYQGDGFEVLMVTDDDGQPLLYTRRVAASVPVEGAAP